MSGLSCFPRHACHGRRETSDIPWGTPVPRLAYSDRVTTRVGVLGARGKVGREVCDAVVAAEDLQMVARVDTGDGDDTLEDLAGRGAQVVVDFTHPAVVMDNLEHCV